jgi:hypothetical protein
MPLEVEINAYEQVRGELERQCNGKFVVFYGSEHIGPFDSLQLAAQAAVGWRGEKSFLIRRVGVDELLDLVDQVTPENRHDEINWGKPVGKEVW